MPVNPMKMELDEDEMESAMNAAHGQTRRTEANLMWIEKYRPQDLQGVISHQNVIETISKLVEARKLPHLLLYGPPGTGKTTTILACARQLNGAQWQSMTLELNASDERGIDVIRERIKSFASTRQIFATGFKLVILDEADAMTNAAQFALRRVIEKYTKNTRFCLICNYVNKIIPALQSRCTKFRFAPLDRKSIEAHLRTIASTENVNITQNGYNAILTLSGGDMRKCLNIMQSTHTGFDEVNEETVHQSTGSPMLRDIKTILDFLLNSDFQPAYEGIAKMQVDKGIALTDIVTALHKLLIRIKLDPSVLCEVLVQLADLEHRLATSTREPVQLASLVGIFQIVRHKSFELQRSPERSRST